MKAENLQILKDNGINVPNFISVLDEEEIDLSFSNCDLFSVRSSCNVEDSENCSFAGQFKTLLFVNREGIINAVKEVKKSYKINLTQCQGVSFGDLYNIKNSKVIIQEMINSDVSGVLFTANPMGILNEMVITVGYGVGTNIVENKIDTNTYHYNIDDKIFCYENNKSNVPLLSEDILIKLVEIGKQIEEIFQKRMDIEFAIYHNEVYILQARPITTLKIDDVIYLDNSNIVESYPNISLPLTQSFVKDIYYKIFKCLLQNFTNNDKCLIPLENNLKNMVDIVNWRFYYRISNWYSILKMLPFSKKIIEIWQKMLGVENKDIPNEEFKVSLNVKFKIIKNFLKYFRITPNEMNKLTLFFEEKINEYYIDLEKLDTVIELINLYNTAKEEIVSKWYITLINDMYAFIFTYLSKEENENLLSDISNLESYKYYEQLNEVINSFYIDGESSIKFQNLFHSFIDIYGDRSIEELKLETKTYRTNPEMLISYIQNQKKENINKKEVENKSNFFIKRAKIGIANREKSRINRGRLFGLTREIFLKIGKILEEKGKIENYRDIFYLYDNEIYDSSLNLKELILERKEKHIMFQKTIGVNRLVFSNNIIDELYYYNENNGIIIDRENKGVGVSQGIVRGEVIVLNKPDLSLDVRNKIIVTKMTDPGWILLIKDSKGIITEQGSLLSHTAIISRELHKPAIVNYKNATLIFKDKDMIEMDGLKGIVKKLE